MKKRLYTKAVEIEEEGVERYDKESRDIRRGEREQ